MKNPAIPILICSAIFFHACQPKPELSLPEKVAAAYGFDTFGDVKSISYTWNVQRDSVNIIVRDWKWDIQNRSVTFADADTSYTYSMDLPKEQLPPADKGFINDKYWLLFPFQLVWDSGYSYEAVENVTAPISGAAATKLTILYNNEDGYTPGDAYDLYLDEYNMIKEWVFRRGNGAEGRPMTWENVEDHGGIKITTEHKNADGQRVIWFSNIKIEK